MARFYIGRNKCCGAITAALVDDSDTTADEVAKFARKIARTGRNFAHVETETRGIDMGGCECMTSTSVGKPASHTNEETK